MEHLRANILTQIDRLRRDGLTDHQEELRKLHIDYNRIAYDIYGGVHGIPCDILDIFPPEIWIQIIKDSLPLSGYASALLLLTMVSTRWRDTLISIPSLWSHIEIRGSEHDSLATIETFKHLSRETPILLSIYAPSLHDITFIRKILAQVDTRLREVIICLDVEHHHLESEDLLRVFNVLLSVPNSLSNVLRIHLEHSSKTPLYQLDTAVMIANTPLPPRLQELHGWSFNWREMCTNERSTECLETIESFRPLDDVLTSRMYLPELKILHIAKCSPWLIPYEDMIQEGLPHMPKLTQLLYNSAYRSAVVRLVQSVAPQLLKLELRIPMHKCDLILPCLEAATQLETLCLYVDKLDGLIDEGVDHYVGPKQHHLDPATSMPHLRHLTLDVSFPNPNETNTAAEMKTVPYQIIRRLIDTFRVLYKDVERMEFDIKHSDAILPLALEYISELPRIRILRMESTVESAYDKALSSLVLPPLEELDTCSTKLLHNLRAPSICSLKFAWGGYCEENGVLNGIDASKLWITGKALDRPAIQFPRDSFPSLVELTISMSAHALSTTYGGLKLNLFPFLKSVTIIASINANYATDLCFELLYHPDNCPSLSHLLFPSYPPDWDILFMMLERRNFMANKAISRIHRITLPFISYHLRAPLAALLRGLFTSRPSNKELFMGGDVRCFLDKQIPGCYTCLSNFLVPCEAMVDSQGNRPSTGDADLIRTRMSRKNPPQNIGTDLPEWIITRQSMYQEFLSDLEIWAETHSRVSICGRRWKGSVWGITVEITEHEQLD